MYAYDPKNSAVPKAVNDKNNMLVMQLKCSSHECKHSYSLYAAFLDVTLLQQGFKVQHAAWTSGNLFSASTQSQATQYPLASELWIGSCSHQGSHILQLTVLSSLIQCFIAL